MRDPLRNTIRVIAYILFTTLACIVFGYVVMRLWNWLMPMIFGLRMLTYLQAVGLLVLSKLLLGGVHHHGGRRGGRCGGRGGRMGRMDRQQWKHQMKERFGNMTPEERERFRAGMRGRRGFPPNGADGWPGAGPNTEAGPAAQRGPGPEHTE
jgi:hypothetical protein